MNNIYHDSRRSFPTMRAATGEADNMQSMANYGKCQVPRKIAVIGYMPRGSWDRLCTLSQSQSGGLKREE